MKSFSSYFVHFITAKLARDSFNKAFFYHERKIFFQLRAGERYDLCMIEVWLAPSLPVSLIVLNISAIIKYLPLYTFVVTPQENEYGLSYSFSISNSLILSLLPTIFRCLEKRRVMFDLI